MLPLTPLLISIADPDPVQIAWLQGGWCTAAAEKQTCEIWLPDQDRMHGVSMTTNRKGEIVGSEAMEIKRVDGKLVFLAKPAGAQAWSSFALAAETTDSMTFESAAHDYPQRIRYWRDGKALMAEISLVDGSKARRWRYLPKR